MNLKRELIESEIRAYELRKQFDEEEDVEIKEMMAEVVMYAEKMVDDVKKLMIEEGSGNKEEAL